MVAVWHKIPTDVPQTYKMWQCYSWWPARWCISEHLIEADENYWLCWWLYTCALGGCYAEVRRCLIYIPHVTCRWLMLTSEVIRACSKTTDKTVEWCFVGMEGLSSWFKPMQPQTEILKNYKNILLKFFNNLWHINNLASLHFVFTALNSSVCPKCWDLGNWMLLLNPLLC